MSTTSETSMQRKYALKMACKMLLLSGYTVSSTISAAWEVVVSLMEKCHSKKPQPAVTSQLTNQAFNDFKRGKTCARNTESVANHFNQ